MEPKEKKSVLEYAKTIVDEQIHKHELINLHRYETINKKLDGIIENVEEINKKLDDVNKRFQEINKF